MEQDLRAEFEALEARLEGLTEFLKGSKHKRLANKAVKLSTSLSEMKVEYADLIYA